MFEARRIVAALADLDPENRAVIELSARRGMSDDELAGALGTDAGDVHSRRERATRELARVMELRGPGELQALRNRLARLDEKAWREPASTPEPERKRRPVPLALVGAAVLVGIATVVAVVVIAGGGEEGGSEPGADRAKPGPSSAPRNGPVVALERLNGTRGRGTAQLIRRGRGSRLRLQVTRLLPPQRGGYGVWLYNSPGDARQLASTRSTRFVRVFRLSPRYTRYRFLDLSREVTRDPKHGGLSLLRARFSELGRAGG